MTTEAPGCTARERQVLEAIAEGLACRDIATRLGISEATVRKHRSNMLAKLGLRNAAQLVAHARTRGWLAAFPVQHFREPVGA
ncbi:response regulator transcription factor [Rubrivivax gelatinosus]|nr:LuxR C-terminal-related transcriptional regulator [Rubrivivax gelatinosus]